jgi:hypothetical protein
MSAVQYFENIQHLNCKCEYYISESKSYFAKFFVWIDNSWIVAKKQKFPVKMF